MSLYDIIQNILDVSKNHNLVREVGEGDIYKYLNSSEHQYPCVFLTVSSINDDLNLRNVNCTLFYVDRLTSDESNKILVQSLGLSVLGDIVERLAGDVDTVEYTTFTEKFTDLCGGVYASLSIGYPLDGACSNDFEVRELEVTENGVYDVLGYDRIVVTTSPKFVVPKTMCFSSSSFKELPDNLVFEDRTSCADMFSYNYSLQTIPYFNTSKCTDFSGMFRDCTKLTAIPHLDTSNGTSFFKMFDYCRSLMSIPKLDTSKGTMFRKMFSWFGFDRSGVYENPMVPYIDTSNGTDFGEMFSVSGLVPNYDLDEYGGFPELDVSKGQYFDSMFEDCGWLRILPPLNTVNGENFERMFYDCNQLKTIKELNLSRGTKFNNMFTYDYSLENIKLVGSINYSISFSPCTKLTYESVKSILTACSNTTNTDSKEVIFNRTLTDQNNELADLIATCNTKGWTVSGLTLQ